MRLPKKSQMKEEFNVNFLNKRSPSKLNEVIAEDENQTETEYKESIAEFKMNENFYNRLFKKLKMLCLQDKVANESDMKSNVSYRN